MQFLILNRMALTDLLYLFPIKKYKSFFKIGLRLVHNPQNTNAKCPSFQFKLKINLIRKTLKPMPNISCNRAEAQWLTYVHALA